MKKITSYLIIIIILFNFIFCNSAYADNIDNTINDLGTSGIDSSTTSGPQQEELFTTGQTTDGDIRNSASNESLGKRTKEAVIGILAVVIDCVPLAIQYIMMAVAYDGSTDKKMVTIEDIVFGEIDVLSIDYFDDTCNSEMIKSFRKSVAQWYYTFRLIAAAIGLLVLIYIGIRMALSVTSGDKARYKEMLMGWVESMLLLFVLHYLIAIFIHIGGIFTNAISGMKGTLVTNSFETTIMYKVNSLITGTTGWESFGYSIFFWILIFIQTKFFLAYAKRLLTVGFLILISPLVTVVYAIDKAGDGKAQSFSNWMKELGVNVFIQPVEALIYIVFMGIAGELAEESMMIAMIFLLVFTKIEKTMLQIFNIRGMSLHVPHDQRKG